MNKIDSMIIGIVGIHVYRVSNNQKLQDVIVGTVGIQAQLH
jgi:hypothetical protein